MRMIYYSNPTTNMEGVFFTEDSDMDAKDALPPNCKVEADIEVDGDFPGTFPTDMNFEHKY